jgi:hypothetical protein
MKEGRYLWALSPDETTIRRLDSAKGSIAEWYDIEEDDKCVIEWLSRGDEAGAEEDDMTKKDQLFCLMAALDGYFAADDCSPADQDRWRELRRHVVRMCDALALGHLTVAGEPLTSVTARKLKGYVKFGLGEN